MRIDNFIEFGHVGINVILFNQVALMVDMIDEITSIDAI